MSEPASTRDSHPAVSHCENCAAPLQGEFCHQCGQSTRNPVRHAGRAVEELFEAFWHLDGRVFRTLRELLIPGKVACNYLAGHRARYIAPLRLFVILSVLTFFIGKLTIQVDTDSVSVGNSVDAITNSQTVEEVRRNRDRLLAEIEQERTTTGESVPGVNVVLIAAQAQIRAEAADRIAELTDGNKTPAATEPDGPVFVAGTDTWDPETNPVRVGWLPGFANDWINRKLVRGKDNVERMQGHPDLWLQAFMGSVPSALFLLVPVFALMLKVAYLLERRLYLEHLVVALYSHIFLLMTLTAIFLLSALGGWIDPQLTWLARVADVAVLGLLLWMPAYLLLMQKRVYGQGWPLTTIKYLVIGFVYFVLLAFATSVMFLATLVRT